MDGEPRLGAAALDRWDLDSGDVARFQAGDTEAFESLVTRREREIFQVALRMLGDRDDAMDAVQDTFVRAYRGLKSFKGKATFRTWLIGIAINVCRSRLSSSATREKQRSVGLEIEGREDGEPSPLPIPSTDPSPESAALGGELRRALDAALAKLSPEHREILILREIHEMDYEELAAALSCAEGTVKSRLCRARAALRQALEGYWP